MPIGPAPVVLRQAAPVDAAIMATIWHTAWHDAHVGRVPAALIAIRPPESFAERIGSRIEESAVAVLDGQVVGFVTLERAEVEQLFVAAVARGTAVATALLAEAESRIRSAGRGQAWLAVVVGNDRAIRFYEREGWRDDGPYDYDANGPDGWIPVPCRRYVKDLT